MTITHIMRPARKILGATITVAVATACLISGPATNSAAPQGSQVGTGHSQVQATKEWKSKTTGSVSPFAAVASRAYPAFRTGTYERRTLKWINVARRNHGLGKLHFASCATHVANAWSSHLASSHGFYHQSMTRLLHVCHARYAGETLGMGSVRPKTLVRMWMNSPPHHHILMSHSPRAIGIGATPNNHGQWVVAANFMRF